MCLNIYNARGNLSGHNLTPLKKGIPTTELVWFTSPRDINLMEPFPVADKYLVVLWISGELKSKVPLSTRWWLDSSVTKLLRNLLSFVSI